ncbi:GFA family protein [Mesorhizobium sp. INR15]|nr:GFA family protein [Mesorhizobium sp. INR15]
MGTGKDQFVALKTYSGSCHCGTVRFEADVDLSQGTFKCNCSSCTKARSWLVVARPDRFRLIAGAEAQTLYQWTPPGHAGPNFKFHFCRNCGIRTPAWGEAEAMGGAFHAIQVTLLDGVDPDELAGAPINYVDGRNDRFDLKPADTRLL